jgi:RHS repeat-associated protein
LGVTYLHGDHLGSSSLTTSNTGTLVAQLRYLPFGGTRWESGATPTDFRFTGQRHESGFGLYDFNARYYDPTIGRFISADTIVPKPENPQSFNRYSYVRNRPLNYIDPTGHCEVLFGFNPGCDGGGFAGSRAFIHDALNVAGVFDPIGVADGVNALLYAQEGDYVNAGLSAAAILPVVGDAGKAGGVGAKARSTFSKSKVIGRVAEQATDGSCLSACGATILQRLGISARETDIWKNIGDWASPGQLAGELKRLDPAGGWVGGGVDPSRTLADIAHTLTSAGTPWVGIVINPSGKRHAVVVNGFIDAKTFQILDPADGTIRAVSIDDFLKEWVGEAIWRRQ